MNIYENFNLKNNIQECILYSSLAMTYFLISPLVWGRKAKLGRCLHPVNRLEGTEKKMTYFLFFLILYVFQTSLKRLY